MSNFNLDSDKKRSLISSYITIGLICSILGGMASAFAFLYIFPQSTFFKNTPLYKNIHSKTTPIATSTNYISNPSVSLSTVEIAKKVGPAVVGVSTKSISENILGMYSSKEGIGSGIIFNDQGYILTNYHVIEGSSKLNVILTINNKHKEVGAKVINYDADLDLAVIKISEDIEMPAIAELGSSENIQVGDFVVAIGNPLGKELLGTVTTGVISAKDREIQISEDKKQTLLQTDAAINPGNSGGALVNSFGQVIGINSAKISISGVEGLGFAIPIDIVKSKIENLSKPILKLGIAGIDITPELSKANDLPEGFYIAQIEKSSPAEKGGLQIGDIIQKFDDKTIKSISEINKIKSQHKANDVINVQVIRENKVKNISLKLTQ